MSIHCHHYLEKASCWPRIAEVPLSVLKSAVALVFCIHAGVSELLAHEEVGGYSYNICRSRGYRGPVLRDTKNWCLRSFGGS